MCGGPLPGFEVEIRDDMGRVLPERRVGRIFLRSPSVMQGYYNLPEISAEILSTDGWLNTGDLGYRVDGALYLTGRAKDLLTTNIDVLHNMAVALLEHETLDAEQIDMLMKGVKIPPKSRERKPDGSSSSTPSGTAPVTDGGLSGAPVTA